MSLYRTSRLLTRLPHRTILPRPPLTRPFATEPVKPDFGKDSVRPTTKPADGPHPADLKDDNWIYTKERDPMAGMTEEEKEAIRKNIREESQRMFSISYGILGGGVLLVGLGIFYWLNDNKRRR